MSRMPQETTISDYTAGAAIGGAIALILVTQSAIFLIGIIVVGLYIVHLVRSGQLYFGFPDSVYLAEILDADGDYQDET